MLILKPAHLKAMLLNRPDRESRVSELVIIGEVCGHVLPAPFEDTPALAQLNAALHKHGCDTCGIWKCQEDCIV